MNTSDVCNADLINCIVFPHNRSTLLYWRFEQPCRNLTPVGATSSSHYSLKMHEA